MHLKTYLKQQGISYKEFAYMMGVEVTTVYRWLSGDRVPPLQTAVHIEDKTSGAVTCRDWIDGKSQ